MFRSLFVLIIVLIVACQDGVTPGGHINATKNQVSWSSDAIAVFEPVFGDSLISIVGKEFNNQGFLREQLAFSKVPPRAGIYEVFISGAPHTYLGIGVSYTKFEGDGHVISEYQTLDTTYQNTFSVDVFEESSSTLKATFECRMMYVNGSNDTTYTIFKDGSINVVIEEY